MNKYVNLKSFVESIDKSKRQDAKREICKCVYDESLELDKLNDKNLKDRKIIQAYYSKIVSKNKKMHVVQKEAIYRYLRSEHNYLGSFEYLFKFEEEKPKELKKGPMYDAPLNQRIRLAVLKEKDLYHRDLLKSDNLKCISKGTLYNYCNGFTQPIENDYDKIAKELNVTTAYLKGIEDLEEYCDWLEDKIETAKGKSLFQYIDQLECENQILRKKIDELESKIKFIEEVQTPDYERVQNELWNLEKALDKASLELELSNKQLRQLDNRFLPMTSKDWKEYLLNEK